MSNLRSLNDQEATLLETTLQEVYAKEAEPWRPAGSHAMLMMVIRQLYGIHVDKVTAKEIAERELARYYSGYR
jgi:nitroimidazol reductase NimA-like FMN-containing flavoprotein (pyridoxamine 5'-phosphate oxidase superfamily)